MIDGITSVLYVLWRAVLVIVALIGNIIGSLIGTFVGAIVAGFLRAYKG